MQIITSFISGLIFGIALILSGMTDPYKVISFLDFSGRWNPSLAFVMGGAVFVGTLAFRYAKYRNKTLLGGVMQLPAHNKVDLKLIFGALTFGVGWGLAGYCPGPAITSLSQGGKPLIFVLSMIVGMAFYEILNQFNFRNVKTMSQK